MILATCLASLAAFPGQPGKPGKTDDPTCGAVIYVRGALRFEPLVDVVDSTLVPIPLLSRSERVVRAARTPRGIGLRVYTTSEPSKGNPPLKLRFVEHADDERIVRDPMQRLWRLSASRWPRSVHRTGSATELSPWTAREDDVGVTGSLEVDVGEPRAGARLVVLGCEMDGGVQAETAIKALLQIGDARSPFAMPRRPFEAALLANEGPWPDRVRLELAGGASADQILLADAELVDVKQLRNLECREVVAGPAHVVGRASRGGLGPTWPSVDFEPTVHERPVDGIWPRVPDSLSSTVFEFWFEAPPAAAPGRTMTLILDFDGGWAAAASEPRAKQAAQAALFRDVAHSSGIDMVHMEGPDLQLDIRPTMGPGAAWGDIDGDGWVDLFLPQGGGREGVNVPTSRMYRNKGDGTFEDVTDRSGLALQGLGMGALFFDADGDGDLDLFVCFYGRNRLLLNDGHGRFGDVSDAVGLQGDSWHAAVSAADYDGDGDLDLYVTSYLHYDESQMPPADELGQYQREEPIAMLPYAFAGERKAFLRNDRRQTIEASTKEPKPVFHFVDVADELGLADKEGRGMQAIFWDFDRDGKQDLYLANDESPNRFWRNLGNGKWKDIAFSTGTDDPRGCMGLAVGDIDGDGDEDLVITNWQLEANALYVNNLVSTTGSKSRMPTFRDRAVDAGIAQLAVGVTKWGVELADFDLDGDLDLFYANGYTSPDYETTGICVGQPCHYFENDGEGHFTPAFEKAGPDAAIALAGRCAIACDYDQDGDLDLVVTANNGCVRLLRNELDHGRRHWLGVRLHGKGGNTFAIGAEVTLKAAGKTLRRSLRAGASYLGGNAPELHFGLGEASTIDECVVRWPDGKETKHAIGRVDAFLTIAEPE